jgi:NAD(P)H-hydrate repair Nnr-like enzyme with NAD(P)H-hydrate dehydratase domain
MGTSPREQASDRLAAVRALAKTTGAVALLKGSRSLVAEPGGVVRVNPTGSSVLATAGSGDVLTGAIAGLLARGVAPADAAASAAYLHGLAGILSGAIHGEGTVAGDLVELLPQALAKVNSR